VWQAEGQCDHDMQLVTDQGYQGQLVEYHVRGCVNLDGVLCNIFVANRSAS